jgi:hypothetical protein
VVFAGGGANLSISLSDQLTKRLDNALQTQAVSEKDCAEACASMIPQHDELLQSTGHIHSYAQGEIRARSQRGTVVQANTLSRRFQTQSVLSSMHSLWKSADLSTNFITCPSKGSGSDTDFPVNPTNYSRSSA